MSVQEYKLPDVGEGLTEAEIVTWRVKVGDTVKVNDVVVEIETAKSLVELPSPFAGSVVSLLVPEGETVPVGTPIIAIGDPADVASGGAAAQGGGAADGSEQAQAGGEEERQPTLVGYGPREASSRRRPRKRAAEPASRAGGAAQQQVHGAFTPGAAPETVEEHEPADEQAVPAVEPEPLPRTVAVLAKPPVRKLAKDLGVDLAAVTATGPGGTITRDDVQQAAERGGQPAPAEAAPAAPREAETARETREPIRGVRRSMAQAMVRSAFTAPHVTEWVTVDATRTMKFLERLRGAREFADVKVSPLLVAAKAVCLAVRRTPEVNATWDDDAQEVVYKSYVNLGIAAATPRGLVVPNVKDADRLPLADLARALNDLTGTAREGRTPPEDMSGGTFTITNVGVFGVDAGTPIINPGESAILCLGAVRQQPWVHKGRVRPRWVTTLALSFDHRLIDGEKGSLFLADVAAILEDPRRALLY